MNVEVAVSRLLDVSSRKGLHRALVADHAAAPVLLPVHTILTPEPGPPRCPRCHAVAR